MIGKKTKRAKYNREDKDEIVEGGLQLLRAKLYYKKKFHTHG